MASPSSRPPKCPYCLGKKKVEFMGIKGPRMVRCSCQPTPVAKLKVPKVFAQDSPWLLNLGYPTVAFSQAHKGAMRDQVLVITNLEDLPGHESLYGFIYRITDRLSGKFYIGQKSLGAATKKTLTDKQKKERRAVNPLDRVSILRGRKPSDWLFYWGSNEPLKADVLAEGATRFCREIIDLCCNKKYQTLSELEQMFKHDVLRRFPDSYNDNILGTFFRRDLRNCPDDEPAHPSA